MGLLSAWAVQSGIVTWRAFKRDQRAPLPSEFVAVFILFGTLGLLAEVPNMKGTAAVTGWGIVLASAFSLVPEAVPGSGQLNGGKARPNPLTPNPASGTSVNTAAPTRVIRN